MELQNEEGADVGIIVEGDRLVQCTICDGGGVDWEPFYTGAAFPENFDHLIITGYDETVCSICHGSGWQGIQRVEVEH